MELNPSQITGIILAGGKSKRMGCDKGLLNYQGKPLVAYSINLLKNITSTILISTSKSEYLKFGYPLIEDVCPNAGPMGGIHSCLKKTETEHNIVIACDTPFLNLGFIHYLLDQVQGYQFVLPTTDGQKMEPLCAYYNKSMVSAVEFLLHTERFKLLYLFEKVKYKVVEIHAGLDFYSGELFANFNTPKDLDHE